MSIIERSGQIHQRGIFSATIAFVVVCRVIITRPSHAVSLNAISIRSCGVLVQLTGLRGPQAVSLVVANN